MRVIFYEAYITSLRLKKSTLGIGQKRRHGAGSSSSVHRSILGLYGSYTGLFQPKLVQFKTKIYLNTLHIADRPWVGTLYNP